MLPVLAFVASAGCALLVDAQTPGDLLLEAVTNDDPPAVRRLLREGANPNAVNARGDSALLVAAIKGSREIAAALLANGASVDRGNTAHFTPLMAASAHDDLAIARLLLENGASVNAKDQDGTTSVMAATFQGQTEVLSLLLASGGDFNAQDHRGMTPLMLAAGQCRVGATKSLWNAGASADLRDNSGNSAFTYAAGAKCPLIIRVSAAQSCKDMSSLYSSAELQRWEPIFRRELLEAKDDIEKQFKADKRARLHNATVRTPLAVSECKDPFYYTSLSSTGEIVIPVLSLRFLYDLLFADAWLHEKGYVVKTADYVNMLKYKRPIDFPRHRYPTPLEALGIPHSAEAARDASDMAFGEFDTIFKGVLFFILAHESAHIALGHSRSTPENETIADAFAMEILSRYHKFAGGIFDLFWLASYWSQNGGDFEDPYQYRSWLTAEATHPVSAARLQTLGASLSTNPERYLTGLPANDPKVQSVKDLGLQLIGLADRLDRYTTLSDLFEKALRTDLTTLAPRKVR